MDNQNSPNQDPYRESPENITEEIKIEPIPKEKQDFSKHKIFGTIDEKSLLTEEIPNQLNSLGGETENVPLPNLRTYEEDFKDAIKDQELSAARIAMIEQQKRAKEETVIERNEQSSKRNLTYVWLSLFLILIAGLIFVSIKYWGYIIKTPVPTTKNEFEEIIRTDNKKIIEADKNTPDEIVSTTIQFIANKESASLEQGKLTEIIFVTSTTTIQDNKEIIIQKPITLDQFIGIFDLEIPEYAVRAIEKRFNLGVYGTETGYEPFLIMKINDISNALPGMWQYESKVIDDSSVFFFQSVGLNEEIKKYLPNYKTTEEKIPEQNIEIPNSTTTNASSTSATSTNQATTTTTLISPKVGLFEQLGGQALSVGANKNGLLSPFVDKIIKNQNARVVLDDRNNILIYYTILNQKYIVFAHSQDLLPLLQERINVLRLVR